jgi:hypothetical protein
MTVAGKMPVARSRWVAGSSKDGQKWVSPTLRDPPSLARVAASAQDLEDVRGLVGGVGPVLARDCRAGATGTRVGEASKLFVGAS